jgi:hypothetical protein
MVQQIIITVLLITAVFFLLRTLYNAFKFGRSCENGCAKCAEATQKAKT